MTLLSNRELLIRAKSCLVGVFPDIVKYYANMTNLPTILLRSFENVAPGSQWPWPVTFRSQIGLLNLEVSTAFVFRGTKRTDRQTDVEQRIMLPAWKLVCNGWLQEKPHKCSMCSKSFPTPGDLKSHMYVHSGSWPYKCDMCSRGFSKQANLRNHMILHTGSSAFSRTFIVRVFCDNNLLVSKVSKQWHWYW